MSITADKMTKPKKGTGVRRRDRLTGDAKSFKHDYSKEHGDKSWPYYHGRMDKAAKLLLVLFPLVVIGGIAYTRYMAQLRELVKTPLDAPLIINPQETLHDAKRFWGTYRSGLYFGMKTRTPKSPVAGMMWLTQLTNEMPPPLRHWCEQGDQLPMYSWFAHDGVSFGVQQIVDKYVRLTNDFVKRPGGQHGGDWSARFIVEAQPGAEKALVSLFFYMALDGEGELEPEIKKSHLLTIRGHSEHLGGFNLVFPRQENGTALFDHLITYADSLEHLKERVMQSMTVKKFKLSDTEKVQYMGLAGTRMPPGIPPHEANFMVHQVTFILPYTTEMWFESESFTERPDHLSGAVYQKVMNNHIGEFTNRVEEKFGLKSKGFSESHQGFAKAILSNMLGTVGYFYGHSLVKSQYSRPDEPQKYWDAPLLTGVPSRSFFPRGFLWDEGFHNLLIGRWDEQLSMEILGHWLDLVNIEGWIPREQILGNEARARVPEQFVVQHNENANPPTLFLPLQRIVHRLVTRNTSEDHQYLQRLFPRLKAWYNWYATTQNGPEHSTYRWRGRDPNAIRQINPLTLTSGLDDYPRASHPTSYERHIDLRCWMALASGVMAEISGALGQPAQEYRETHSLLTDNALLDRLHWSEANQRYSDYGLHTDNVKLERPPQKPLAAGQRPPPPQDKVRVAKSDPTYGFVDSTFGYVSLFPFLIKIVKPDSLKLGRILTDLHDPSLLWTKYGLRSLAKTAPLYRKYNTEHDPPYWRGNIWINLNYMALGALDHYRTEEGPHRKLAAEIYTELRENLINNIMQQYQKTGYIWENYEDSTGLGKGSHPFTGWSALVVAIMAEEY